MQFSGFSFLLRPVADSSTDNVLSSTASAPLSFDKLLNKKEFSEFMQSQQGLQSLSEGSFLLTRPASGAHFAETPVSISLSAQGNLLPQGGNELPLSFTANGEQALVDSAAEQLSIDNATGQADAPASDTTIMASADLDNPIPPADSQITSTVIPTASADASGQQSTASNGAQSQPATNVPLADENGGVITVNSTASNPNVTGSIVAATASPNVSDTENNAIAIAGHSAQQAAASGQHAQQDAALQRLADNSARQSSSPSSTVDTAQGKTVTATVEYPQSTGMPQYTGVTAIAAPSGQSLPFAQTLLASATAGQTLEQKQGSLLRVGELAATETVSNDTRPSANSSVASMEQIQRALQTGDSSRPVISVPVQHGSWGEAVGRQLMSMHNGALQQANIQLDPPELGPLQVQIQTQQEQTSVVFNSQHGAVRDALEQSLPRLREMFEQQGLNLVDVNIADHNRQQSGQQTAGQQGDVDADTGTLLAADDSADTQGSAAAAAPAMQSQLSLIDAYA